jgi:hypothetical protein
VSCLVEGCDRPVKVAKLCWVHYMRKRRTGSFDVTKADDGKPLAFLRANLGYLGEECLIWPFAHNDGYGVLEYRKGHNIGAHRYMCILAHGEPPFPKAQAAHSCGNGKRGCVAPNHLRWATRHENEQDKFIHGTTPRGERHGLSKLTSAEVLFIVADQRSHRAIASDFGCSQTSVSAIKSGQTWSWLTGIKRAA